MGLFDKLFGQKAEEKELAPAEETPVTTELETDPTEGEQAVAPEPVAPETSASADQSAPQSSLERAMEILRDKEKRAAAIREAEAKQAEEARLAVETQQVQDSPVVEEAEPVQPEPSEEAELATSSLDTEPAPTQVEPEALSDQMVTPEPALVEEEVVPVSVSSQEAVQAEPKVEPAPAQERTVQAEPVQTETTQEKYERSLKKTRTGFGAKLNAFFANFRTVDEEFFEDLEELLITSDVGVQVATRLTEELRQEAKLEKVKRGEELRRLVIEKLVDIYEQDGDFAAEKINFQEGLTVMLFVGVNGVGKTTSIGKLAHKYKQEGKKVMLVAADTFRAGAVAQLAEWARRVDVDIVTGPEKSDPASVVFDGMEKAVAEGVDVLMIDTAGRLQNKDNLMAELEKIGRIIKRVLPDAPHETLLALDASTGQNALSQAKEFSKITPLTGLVLTKIDGTARGGVVLAIRQELSIPVKLIGFGEKIDDIGQFNSEDFMRGLLEGLI